MKTYVIILNWNGGLDTISCLNSLLKNMTTDTGVVVCDNASVDDSVNRIESWLVGSEYARTPVRLTRKDVDNGVKAKPGSVIILQNGANLGFAGGNNSGIQLAINDKACDYIWLLNNDTVVNSSSLYNAINRMNQDDSIGICGSSLIYANESDKVQAFGGAIYSKWTGRSRHIGAFAKISEIPSDPSTVESTMSYVVGAAMLVRRAFIEQIGLMREDYFLYCEENDWACRGRKQFKLGYAPDSLVWHKEGASIGTSASGGSPLSIYYLFRNRVKFAWRFTPAYLPSVFLFCLYDIAKMLLKRQWSNARAALVGIFQLSL